MSPKEEKYDYAKVDVSKPSLEDAYQTYPIRWLILTLFSLHSMLNATQWAQYTIIPDIIRKYYSVSNEAVEWTGLSYMVMFVLLFLPGTFGILKLGLRWVTFIGAVITMLGAWLKLASVSPDRFWVGMLAQFICGLGQVFVLSVPPPLAATWFSPKQVATATAIGVFGNQLGICVSFVTSTKMVRDSENLDDIGQDLFVLFLSIAIVQTIMVLLIFFLFKSEPPTPPSPAHDNKDEELQNIGEFFQSMKRLSKNLNFILMLLTYGINVGAFYAVSIMLGELILPFFEGAHEFAGLVGVLIILAGTVGSIISGIILDRTRRFKETTLVLYVFSGIGMMAFTFTIETNHQIATYLVSALLGFFMAGYLPVGLEFAAELTFPEPESSSSGLMTAAVQLITLILVPSYRGIIDAFGHRVANLACSLLLLIGAGVTAFISSDLRRQKAIEDAKTNLNVIYRTVKTTETT